MGKLNLSERDISAKSIAPALRNAGWCKATCELPSKATPKFAGCFDLDRMALTVGCVRG